MKTAKDVQETFQASVQGAINGDRKHGWGQKDSMMVITDLLEEFSADYLTKEVKDAVNKYIERVVNPSAMRQWLESSKVNLLDKQDAKRTASATFAEF